MPTLKRPHPAARQPSASGDGARPQGWATGRLDWMLRIVDEGPRPFYRAAVVSAGLTSVLAIGISVSIRPAGPLPWPQRHMIAGSLIALCLSALLGTASRVLGGGSRHAAWADRIVAPRQRAAIWLALAVWFPFLLVVVYYRARATFPPSVRWLYYVFDDKRWIAATYLLGALAPMIALTAAARILAVGNGHPPTWRAWLAGLFPRAGSAASEPPAEPHELTDSRRRRAVRILPVAASLATALGLAWYFLGPPWYLTQNSSLVTPQETLWLTGFQAIAHGYLPYTGPAEVQYGPGAQLASYLIMRHVTSFSLVGFREAWALFQWAGASVLFAVFFLAFGYTRGLAVSLLSALVYPALQQVAFKPGAGFEGYFGWADPLRYAGMIALVALLPAVVRRCESRWGLVAGAGLGALWGVTSYLAQENLIAGAVGALLVGALLLLSGTAAWNAVRAALVAALAGFLLIWLPILACYAISGHLVQFVKLYFLLAQAIAQGFGNMPWQGGTHMPFSLVTMFYVLPFLLAAVAFLTVFEVRPVRLAVGWSRERVRLAVTVIISALLYQGVLLRSDPTDMTGTLLMVPALVIATATVLPRLLGGRRRVTVTIAGAALAAASSLLMPRSAFAWTHVRTEAAAPYLDRQRLAAAPRPSLPVTPAARRVGSGLDNAPQCCQGPPLPMADLANDMDRIHAIIGKRMTYVVNFPHGYPGFVYFVADLTPAPAVGDEYNTVLNQPQLTAYMAYFKASVLPHTQALVTGSLTTPEARLFLQRYPGARRILLHLGRKPYHVLLARG